MPSVAFAKNYNSASNNFAEAIEGRPSADGGREDGLLTSENRLRLAQQHWQTRCHSVKKLTRKNPTMRPDSRPWNKPKVQTEEDRCSEG